MAEEEHQFASPELVFAVLKFHLQVYHLNSALTHSRNTYNNKESALLTISELEELIKYVLLC